MVVGRVGRPHGVRGEVTVVPETDYAERFAPGSRLLADEEELTVVGARPQKKGGLIVSFQGVDDREGAEELRGRLLEIVRSRRRPLEEDEFWPDQLEGLEVRDRRGLVLGRVVGVVIGAAQDRLVVETAAGERAEVPFVPALVGEVRVEEGWLEVDPIEGLL